MWSFLISVALFTVLVIFATVWQRRTQRVRVDERAKVDQQILDVAEVAQRRHVQRFGRASTDLAHAIADMTPVPVSATPNTTGR